MQSHSIDPGSSVPRYYQIYSALLAMISSGELKSGDTLPPERQIADDFGVARLTVVKALDLLERDGRIEKQQGRGNIVMNVDTSNSLNTIAFVGSPPITHELVAGISQYAFEGGYHLQVLGVDANFENLEAYLSTCLESNVQGFIVYGRGSMADGEIYQQLLGNHVPIVMVDRYYPDLECDHVVYDNELASYQLTRRLLARGHQRIAVIPGPEIATTAVKDRLAGFSRAMAEHNLNDNEDMIWPELYSCFLDEKEVARTAYQAGLTACLEAHQPTAILTINDHISNYLVHDLLQLRDKQMRQMLDKGSPSVAGSTDDVAAGFYWDLELATFGSQAVTQHSYLKLFAVHPTFELGRRAAALMIERLNGTVKGYQQLTLPMDIVDCSDPAKPVAVGKEVRLTQGELRQ